MNKYVLTIIIFALFVAGCTNDKPDDSILKEMESLNTQIKHLEIEIEENNKEHMREIEEIVNTHQKLIQTRTKLDFVLVEIVASLINGKFGEIKEYLPDGTELKKNKVIFTDGRVFTLPEREYLLWQGHFQFNRDGSFSTEYLFYEIEGETIHGRIHVQFNKVNHKWIVNDLYFDTEPW